MSSVRLLTQVVSSLFFVVVGLLIVVVVVSLEVPAVHGPFLPQLLVEVSLPHFADSTIP